MKQYNVAILGVTGAVGQEMLHLLEEYDFPVKTLRPLASKRSAGKTVRFKNKDLTIEEATETSFENMDFVFSAVESEFSKKFAPAAVRAGALFIDNSSAFRLDEQVPLVVPEINPEDAKLHHGIIANPNCSTIITLMAVASIARLSPIQRMIASTYQAVSGAGVGGLRELEAQVKDYAEGKPLENKTFAHEIAFNLLPKIGSVGENGFSSEEMKLQNEGRKILHLPEMKVSCTCVRVPVFRSHSISVTLETEKKLSVAEIQNEIKKQKGVLLTDMPNDELYPMPKDTSGIDTVYVGRIREDPVFENGISLFCCGDQIRKGAAANAVQIALLFLK